MFPTSLNRFQLGVTITDIKELSFTPGNDPLKLDASFSWTIGDTNHLGDDTPNSSSTANKTSWSRKPSTMVIRFSDIIKSQPLNVIKIIAFLESMSKKCFNGKVL